MDILTTIEAASQIMVFGGLAAPFAACVLMAMFAIFAGNN